MSPASTFDPANTDSPPRASYLIATSGATTARNGVVIASCLDVEVEGKAVAVVGDLVRYPDGQEAVIVSGFQCINLDGKAPAVVGSWLDNGDTIVTTPQTSVVLHELEGDEVHVVEFEVA